MSPANSDNQDPIASRISAALNLAARGDLKSALKQLNQIRSESWSSVGRNHPNSIQAEVALGTLKISSGELKEALQHFVRARTRLDQALYPTHPLYVDIFRGLSEIWSAQGFVEEALVFLAKSITLITQIDENHPMLTDLLLQMGRVQRAKGATALCQTTFQRALEVLQINEQHVTAKHIEVMMDLGFLHYQMGEQELAIKQFEKVLEGLAELELDHPKKLNVLFTLHRIYLDLEQLDDSLFYLERILNFIKNGMASSPNQELELFEMCYDDPDLARELPLLVELVPQYLKLVNTQLGTQTEAFIGACCRAASLYQAAGQPEEAKQNLNNALGLLRSREKGNPLIESTILSRLGTLELTSKNISKAKQHLQNALILQQNLPLQDQLVIAQVLNDLAAVSREEGNPEKETEFLTLVSELSPEILSRSHPIYIDATNRLKGEIPEEPKAEAAPEEKAEAKPEAAKAAPASNGSAQDIGAKFNAAFIAMNGNEHGKASKLFEEILTYMEGIRGKNHPELVPILQSLASTYEHLGLKKQAEAAKERASKIA